MKKLVLIFLTVASITACKNANENKQPETLAKENSQNATGEQQEEWHYLFDGTNADGWRAYNSEDGLPEGWVIEGETLKSLGQGGDIGGDIVYGKEEFGEFELSLEWKISEGGNSGIFYHVVEDKKYDAPYYVAPEYQIIDQKGFPDKLEAWQSIGGDYGMYNPEYKEEDLKEVGEWNTSRIKFTKDKVTYWLNGKKTVEFVPWSDDWEKRKTEGKWKDFPDYGTARKGLIGLQDHGSFTWFKNIKIRKL
jgi:hypothetical protein